MGVEHGAYTDGTEMRAIVVELTGDGADPLLEADAHAEAVESTTAADRSDAAPPSAPPNVTRAEGGLAERQLLRDEYPAEEGEPW
jgi:hypothetical protein